MRYIAQFHPEEWVNDRAVEVESQGSAFFDVTDFVEAASPTLRVALLDSHSFGSDTLRDAATAPSWVKAWSGPFEITVFQEAEEAPDRWKMLEGLARATAKLVEKQAALYDEVGSCFPDTDGRWGRGFRDGVEATMLAMQAEGVSEAVFTSVLRTVMDAYGNNADKDRGPEIRESLVVSTAHLAQVERDLLWGLSPAGALPLNSIIVVCSGEHQATVYIPNDDEAGPAKPGELPEGIAAHAQAHFSDAFALVLRTAARFGCNYVVFDVDGPTLDGVPTYD